MSNFVWCHGPECHKSHTQDRIKVLESAIESHAKILARFQMTEANEQDFERHEKLWGDK